MIQKNLPLFCRRMGTLAAAGVQPQGVLRGLCLGPSAVRGCGHTVLADSSYSEVRGTGLISDIFLKTNIQWI